MALPLHVVRAIASEEKCIEAYLDTHARVASFVSTKGRVNVYYSTGTVGICIDHPRLGPTQLFRRAVNLSVLKDIFADPHAYTNFTKKKRPQWVASDSAKRSTFLEKVKSKVCTYHMLGEVCPEPHCGCFHGEHENMVAYWERTKDPPSEKMAVKERLEELREEARAVGAELVELEGALARLEAGSGGEGEERVVSPTNNVVSVSRVERFGPPAAFEKAKRKAAKERVKARERQAAGRKRGKGMRFSVVDGDFVEERFGRDCTCIATGGGEHCTILLYDRDGEGQNWAYTGGLPKGLHNKLQGRGFTSAPAEYVSVGSEGRYYVRFADRESYWKGPPKMAKELQKSSTVAQSVAFGHSFDSFCIVFKSGDFCFEEIPKECAQRVKKVWSSPKRSLDYVALGERGEWMVAATDGSTWWNSVPDEADGLLKRLDCTFVDFGDDGDYLIRHL